MVHGESKLPQRVAAVTTLAMYPLGVTIGGGADVWQLAPPGVITAKRNLLVIIRSHITLFTCNGATCINLYKKYLLIVLTLCTLNNPSCPLVIADRCGWPPCSILLKLVAKGLLLSSCITLERRHECTMS